MIVLLVFCRVRAHYAWTGLMFSEALAPMLALYFVGIGVSAMVVRKKARQLAAATEPAK